MQHYVYLGLAIVGEVVGTSALKAADGFTQLVPSLIVVLGYASAFYFLSLTLKVIPVGIAYAVWSGVGVVLIAGVGWLIYGQKLDSWGCVGIALIIAGVLVVNVLSDAKAH